MNKPIDRAELERLSIHASDILAQLVNSAESAERRRHGAPFSKRDAGRNRRAERKAKAARRYDWFNE